MGLRHCCWEHLQGIGCSHSGSKMGSAVEKATAPFHYALSTRAGCECIGHALQFSTQRDPSPTITSIDGINAYDTKTTVTQSPTQRVVNKKTR